MTRYIIKRLIYLVVVFVVVSVFLFFLFKLVPGDPARLMVEGQRMSVSPEKYNILYQQARQRLGLDKPLLLQYFSWFANYMTGHFGYSATFRVPVLTLIKPAMINTIWLNLVSSVIFMVICIPLGIKQAVKKDSLFDNTLQTTTILGLSLPSFIIALVFIFLFAIKLSIFPISGMITTGANYTGLRYVADYLYHMALPVIVILVAGVGGFTRYVRGAVLDALSMDFVRTARAKGLTEKAVVYKHAFRNALIPITGSFVGIVTGMFTGSVIIETIFSWNGVGKLLIDSLNQHDYTVVLALQMFYIVLGFLGNLITDLCYLVVDPRVKLDA